MRKCAVIGVGYVGLGLAVELAKHFPTFGYDLNADRIHELQHHCDRNKLLSDDALKQSTVVFTHQLDDLKTANFYTVSVPTPANFYEGPDSEALRFASARLASILKKHDIIVFESTVYPGETEEICVPILEKVSHLRCGMDFHVGYSPERINPGDTEHTLNHVKKIISAQDDATLEAIRQVYSTFCDVYPVSNIKTAEAIKLLENGQRDVNIAYMNEFSKIMHALNLNMHEIMEAAKTKWNYVPFQPGFVGGHCISIDPYCNVSH